MKTYETAADYGSVGQRHLADALELLQHPTNDPFTNYAHTRHLAGAMYLVGYAVECALKRYLIRKFGKTTFGEVITEVKAQGHLLGGGNAHDLTKLWAAAAFPVIDRKAKSHMALCGPWTVQWRYDPTIGKRRDAAMRFVRAAEATYRWIEAQP